MSRKVTHDGSGNLEVRFSFDRRLVDLVKTLPGRRWNPEGKYWFLPDDRVVEIVEALYPEGFRFDERTRQMYGEHGGSLPLEPGPAANAPASPQGDLFADPAPAADGGAITTANENDYSVSRLNEEVSAVLRRAFPDSIWIVGEISGFNKNAHKRHVTFQLVEREKNGSSLAEVGATLFESDKRDILRKLEAAGDPFRLEDEIMVRVLAHIELYVPWGSYRVVVDDLDVNYTLGEAARRREEIIRRLTEEGLLDVNKSLTFPPLPLRVGLITSLHSDAYNDVLRTLQESGFAFEITAHGARVQGRQTEPSVLNALDRFRERSDRFDVVLICRGGGSRTDLSWFDSDALGRAVAQFPLPVVVGIGHEQDYSVLDAVGWRRKTPTAAAGLLVELVRSFVDRTEEHGRTILEIAARRIVDESRAANDRAERLARAARNLLDRGWTSLGHQRERVVRASRVVLDGSRETLLHRSNRIPRAASVLLGQHRTVLASASARLARGAGRDLTEAARRTTLLASLVGPSARRKIVLEKERMDQRGRRLELVDPRRVLERGYAVVRKEAGGVLTDAADAPHGSTLRAELKRGELRLRSEGPPDAS